ncbi:TRAM domain-containing protein, partial [Citrobacter youngae]|uniref:TRAM domain-containing protein n=1 Tax=Citrobacter youngae TaxID=133448 RepID=UPI0013D0EE2A
SWLSSIALAMGSVSKRGDQLYGRIDGNRIVNIPADQSLIGTMAEVTITQDYQNSLLGEILE